jgi:DNA-binding transcriptional MerR regulator
MDEQDDKLTIQQVSEATGLSAHTLRYYERIGLIHPIEREKNTHRRYTSNDVGWVDFLNKLRATGMSIQQMSAYAALQRLGDATLAQRVEMLREHRDEVEAHMAELAKHLEVIRWKVSVYEELLEQEQELQIQLQQHTQN